MADLGKTTCLVCGAPLGPELRHVGAPRSFTVLKLEPWGALPADAYPFEYGDVPVIGVEELARRIGADYGEPV